MKPSGVIATVGSVAVALTLVGAAQAQIADPIPMPHVKSGQPVVMRVAWNCVSHQRPRIEGTALHGTVTILQGVGAHCGHAYEPDVRIVYTSDPGFKGLDGVDFFFFPGTENRSFPVTVE